MKIKIRDYGEIEVDEDENLMSALVKHNIPLQNLCNGKGTCGKCKIRILKGLTEPISIDRSRLSETELESGVRLACRIKVQGFMEIETQSRENYDRKNNVFVSEDVELNTGLQKAYLTIPEPSLKDERGDWDRIKDELNQSLNTQSNFVPPLIVLEKLPRILRDGDYSVTATLWKEQVIDLEPGDTTQSLYGIAVDIGTTSVAAALLDLNSAQVLGVVSAENGQTAFGGDVISRIAYASEGIENRNRLKEAILNTVNTLIDKLLSATKLSKNAIYKMTFVSNTTMSHLFLGLEVSYLAVSPYVSVYNQSFEFSAEELGLRINPKAVIQILPNIGSFVGADTVGAILAAREDLLAPGNHLLIDLGTNCELFLKTETTMLSCSTAAGPAFEGARIGRGMRAKPGAIEGVMITDTVQLKVIGETKPTGICGSGLIEGIDQMRRANIINKRGAIAKPDQECDLPKELKSRIRDTGVNGREFVLAYGDKEDNDISLNQADIGELQLAKGAVCAGIRTLVGIAGITLQDLDSIVLAGTFASYLKKESILNIGLIPETDLQKIRMAGNAAHSGAVLALLSKNELEKACALAQRIQHVELGGNKTFTSYLMKSMRIAPTT